MKKLLYAVLLLALYSCNSGSVFEEVKDIEKEGWKETTVLTYDFEIKENNKPLTVYLKTRYDNTYNFNNLYIQYTLSDSSGKELLKKLDQVLLFEEKTGTPRGTGFAGMYDLDARMYYFTNYKFPYVGKYHLTLKQFMRVSPLEGMKAVGIKVVSPEETAK